MELLKQRAGSAGRQIYFTAEPTDGPIGRHIRAVLRGQASALPDTLAMLYAADRNEHVNDPSDGIRRRLEEGWVISDRYLFSSLAYQGSHCDYDFVYRLNSAFPLPESVVFVELSPEESARRRMGRSNSAELFDAVETQQTVYDAYNAVLAQYAERGVSVHRIDGTPEPSVIADKIWALLFR